MQEIEEMDTEEIVNGKPLKCIKCNSVFIVTNFSKFYVSALMFLPVLLQNYIFDICGNYSIVIYLLWVCLILSISPLLLKVKVFK